MAPPKGHILHIGRVMRCIYSTSLQSAKCRVRMDAHGLLPTLSPAVAIFIFSGTSAAQSLFTIRKSCIQRHPYFYSSSDKPVTDKTTVKAAALFSALQMNVTVMPHIKIWAVLRKIKYRKKRSCQEWRVDIIHIKISPKKMCIRIQEIKRKKGTGDPFIPLFLGDTAARICPVSYCTLCNGPEFPEGGGGSF